MKFDAIIIDGRHLLHRISHVCSKQSREFANIIAIGFLGSCQKIHRQWGGKLFMAWEGEGNFRFDIFPEYKARSEPSEDLAILLRRMDLQQRILQRVLCMLGCEQYLGNGGEGDDVIGYLAEVLKRRFNKIAIYSGDSDLRQLVDAKISTISPVSGSDVVYDVNRVQTEHGVTPEQIPALKALTGDKSDCIPGVEGIGPKKASLLLARYGNLENVFQAARGDSDWVKEINVNLRKRLVDSEPLVRRNLALTTIQTTEKFVRPYPSNESDPRSVLAFIDDLGLRSVIVEVERFSKMFTRSR